MDLNAECIMSIILLTMERLRCVCLEAQLDQTIKTNFVGATALQTAFWTCLNMAVPVLFGYFVKGRTHSVMRVRTQILDSC